MKILVAYDGSEASSNAIKYVRGLLANHKSLDVTILTVACNDAPFAKDFVANPTEALNACKSYFGDKLQKVKESLEAEGHKVNTLLEFGDAAQVIVDVVKKQGFDRVIMGRRGLSTLTGFVLGSVSAKVLANVDVPVTLVK
ncbi:universal stress protein [Desulforamulus ferrireducens]|uniref:Universal stress protein UspA n=1 Tax=Desulforamulus ferrireducens TaxID=1833852 RepID=A0A1S6IV34_9FIRM|nr:universal stress protein [Desulforamulus ferrireducens]AQS58636.1 universal stress protein UspA [Desulforamulus ferrireducens]